MKKLQDHQIYALVGGPYVYVGKSTGKSLQPIRWKHLRGENHHTRNHFARGSPTEPQMFPLTQVHTDVSVAYRYVIAFVRMFWENGYTILNSRGIVEDAMDIHPMTASILDELKPLSKYLVKSPSEPDTMHADIHTTYAPPKRKNNKKEEEKASEKLTARFTPSEKQQFDEFVRYVGVSQRQAIMLLLSKVKYDDWFNPDWSCEEYVKVFLGLYKEEIARQDEEIAALKAKLKETEKAVRIKHKTSEHLVRKGIGLYFQYIEPSNPDNPVLERCSYRWFIENLTDTNRYRYPETEDFFLFWPEYILLGKDHFEPLFVVGKDDRGTNTILRYYPRDSFAGLTFTNERFGLKGSTWLVRAERSKDGAMDLMFALPLDVGHLVFTPPEEEQESQIDDLLENARKRSARGRH